ncbi:MAG: threonylcarbamoyl-AMP synthase [Flavobacteriales bacterium]|nr:threonylcarbamoyl-AMP synthase [Flavobacteriales bacterium]
METREAISETVEHLKKGEIILFPSDTIWGLSCDATNVEAVDRLIQLKGRAQHKSFIVLVNSDRMINQCIKDTPEVAWDMIDYTEEPLTLVLDDGQFVAPNAINQDGSLGIRKVQRGAINTLLSKFNKPIISTSANFSGKLSALTFQEIDSELKNQVDYTFPLEQKSKIKTHASKIVRIRSNGEVEILRK